MRWPLRNQIFVPFSLVTVAVLLVVSVANSYLAAERTSRRIEEQQRRVAAELQNSSFPLTQAVLEQASSLSGVDFLSYDGAGRLVATTLDGAPVSLASTNQRGTLEIGQRRFFRLDAPLAPRADRPDGGRLFVLYDERVLRDARWQAAYPPLIVGLLSVAIVGLVAVAIAGRLSRPIVELQANFARLADGDFEPLPLPQRNDEIRDLVESMNQVVGELNQLRKAIQRTERLALLGQLSGGLAHHLRNAMAGAKLALQLHQRHCTATDRGGLEVALRQLQLTEDHLRQLLTIGQPNPPQREACDLRALVDENVALLQPTARHRNVTLAVLPAETAPLPLVADPGLLRQLVVNLVVNAIEAAGAGGWVRVELNDAAEAVIMRVIDGGPGPPESLRSRLFEPFTTGKPEGVGLGLAVARQVAEQHGGGLQLLDSRPTCFELRLPRV